VSEPSDIKGRNWVWTCTVDDR